MYVEVTFSFTQQNPIQHVIRYSIYYPFTAPIVQILEEKQRKNHAPSHLTLSMYKDHISKLSLSIYSKDNLPYEQSLLNRVEIKNLWKSNCNRVHHSPCHRYNQKPSPHDTIIQLRFQLHDSSIYMCVFRNSIKGIFMFGPEVITSTVNFKDAVSHLIRYIRDFIILFLIIDKEKEFLSLATN